MRPNKLFKRIFYCDNFYKFDPEQICITSKCEASEEVRINQCTRERETESKEKIKGKSEQRDSEIVNDYSRANLSTVADSVSLPIDSMCAPYVL